MYSNLNIDFVSELFNSVGRYALVHDRLRRYSHHSDLDHDMEYNSCRREGPYSHVFHVSRPQRGYCLLRVRRNIDIVYRLIPFTALTSWSHRILLSLNVLQIIFDFVEHDRFSLILVFINV